MSLRSRVRTRRARDRGPLAQPLQGHHPLQPTPLAIPEHSSASSFLNQDHRKIAEMYQHSDSPAETEAIKNRIVRSFNALPDLVGVLMRADKEGGIWQALYNEGITDAYDAALKSALEAIGEAGIADIAFRYELGPEILRAKLAE